MDRRMFIQLIALVPGFGWLKTPTPMPRLDAPWPLDIRERYRNVGERETASCHVYLDGVKQSGVVAVSMSTGHLLKYQLYGDGHEWPCREPGEPDVVPRTQTVTQDLPCDCRPGMHLDVEPGFGRCIPYEIRRGRVEVRYA